MTEKRNYFIDILKIAYPIIFGNLGFIMIGVGDVIVAGRHSTETLSAISIATAVTSCIMMFGIGILVSISAILSNYRGEGKPIEKYFFPSVNFVFILSCITSLAIFACIPLIDKIGFEPNLTPLIKDYFFITGFATFGGYIHCMAKEYLQAFEIVIFPNALTIFSIFVNVFLNIILVFGFGNIPSMGVSGLAVASLITRYFMGIVLILYCFKKLKIFDVQKTKDFVRNKHYYKDLLKVGLPASLAIMIEFTCFNSVSLIMGRVSGIYAAAHNIICTLTSVAFMVPLAIANATSVKVGYSNGAKDYAALKKYAYSGIKMSVIFMLCSASLLGMFPKFFTGLFTIDQNLIEICLPVVYLLCFFQVFDGLQVTFSGIFKGIKKTSIVMKANFVSYWIFALPLGCLLAFKFKLDLFGFWLALGISAVFLCTIMFISMMRKFKKMEL